MVLNEIAMGPDIVGSGRRPRQRRRPAIDEGLPGLGARIDHRQDEAVDRQPHDDGIGQDDALDLAGLHRSNRGGARADPD